MPWFNQYLRILYRTKLSPKELEVFINNFGLIPQSITSLRWDNLIDVNYRLFLPLLLRYLFMEAYYI